MSKKRGESRPKKPAPKQAGPGAKKSKRYYKCVLLADYLYRDPKGRVDWWRYRLPGHGQLNWAEFFTILQDAGYKGALNIEHEDAFYYPPYDGDNFTPQFKKGFSVTHKYLRQFIPI